MNLLRFHPSLPLVRLHAWVLQIALMVLVGTACAQPAPTVVAPLNPVVSPTATFVQPTATPEHLAATPTPSGCLASEQADLVWPSLKEVQPQTIQPGGELTVIGYGGYVRCGSGGYNESARSFQLYFDDQPVSSMTCYVNRCEGKLVVPDEAAVGTHVISVEGESSLDLQVTLDPAAG